MTNARPGTLINCCAGVRFASQHASSSHAPTSICSRPQFNRIECRARCPSRSLVLLVLRDHVRHRRLCLVAECLHAHAIHGFVGHAQFTPKHWRPLARGEFAACASQQSTLAAHRLLQHRIASVHAQRLCIAERASGHVHVHRTLPSLMGRNTLAIYVHVSTLKAEGYI
jgi:hypothetical protein